MCTMSVPMATWTVSGRFRAARATSSECIEARPAVLEDDVAEGGSQADRLRRPRDRRPRRRGPKSRGRTRTCPPSAGCRRPRWSCRRSPARGRGSPPSRSGPAPEDSAVDPVDQVTAAARLDDVPAQRGDDRPVAIACADDRIAQPLEARRPPGAWAGVSSQSSKQLDPALGRPRSASETLLGRSASGS